MSGPSNMPLRELIAKTLYEEPGRVPTRLWEEYPLHHKEHWLADADRVLEVIKAHMEER